MAKFKIEKYDEDFFDRDFYPLEKYLKKNGKSISDFSIFDIVDYYLDTGRDGGGELIGEYDTLEQAREVYNKLEPFISYSSGYNKKLSVVGYVLTEEDEDEYVGAWDYTEWREMDNPSYVEEEKERLLYLQETLEDIEGDILQEVLKLEVYNQRLDTESDEKEKEYIREEIEFINDTIAEYTFKGNELKRDIRDLKIKLEDY